MTSFFRTEHVLISPSNPRSPVSFRTSDQGAFAAEARLKGKKKIAAQLAERRSQLQYLAGFTIDVPGVSAERALEIRGNNRWLKLKISSGDA